MGHTPFGYRIENGIAIIDEPAAAKLRQLYKNYLSGMSLSKAAAEAADISSAAERKAIEAEREVEKMKKAEYMEQFIGETFDGVISGVTSWGMYVELPNTIEGMVRVADIPGDYYYFEEERYQMVGEKTGKIYKLGQKVRVTVSAVDKLLRTIDFELNEEDENEHGEETDRK